MLETRTHDRPAARPRRLRTTPALRSLVAETRISEHQLIQPLFVQAGLRGTRPIASMPGIDRLGLDALVPAAQEATDAGLAGVILFGLPARKDPPGTGAYEPAGIVQQALRRIKGAVPDLLAIADVCLCEYTDHGHCGIVHDGRVDNDRTLPVLAQTAVSLAQAGADVVAPSAMMDGQVAAIRTGLDEHGFAETPILAYAAKYASSFYGPFRQAADSAPQFGDRRGYQMDPANAREALREIEIDLREGADLVLVKPGLPCLDILRTARDRFDVPIGAYQVSGEYAMIKAASERGWIDEARAAEESLVALRRAGADFVITYFAKEAARILHNPR